MSKLSAASYTRGTAALKMPARSCRIISMPDRRIERITDNSQKPDKASASAKPGYIQRVKDRFWELAASSEMVCSLLFEGAAGCACNGMSKLEARQLATVLGIIGFVSLVFGA